MTSASDCTLLLVKLFGFFRNLVDHTREDDLMNRVERIPVERAREPFRRKEGGLAHFDFMA